MVMGPLPVARVLDARATRRALVDEDIDSWRIHVQFICTSIIISLHLIPGLSYY